MGGRGFLPLIVDGSTWISVDRGADPASIIRIDPATNQFDRVLSPGDGFRGGGDMVVADGSLWVLDGASNRVLRLPLSAFAS
jgi:streptogramin lyase